MITIINKLAQSETDNKNFLFHTDPIHDDNKKVLIEFVIFFFFVFDFTVYQNKQSKECRQACTKDIILYIMETYQDAIDETKTNRLFNKRMDEYGECSRQKDFLKFPAMIFNFLFHNIVCVNKNNDFFIFEGETRPLYLAGITKIISFETIFLNEFAAFSTFVHTIVKDTDNFLSLSNEEFEKRIKNAIETENKFWEAINKKK